MYSCKIKFGGITNLTDARYAAAEYADWLGFCFSKESDRYISPSKAKEIIDWVSGPLMVAETFDMEPEELQEALNLIGIETVQCPPGKIELWKNTGFNIIVACRMKELTPALNEHTVLITDYRDNVDLSSFPPRHIIDVTSLSLEAISDLKEKKVYGISLTGGDESGPGLRDFAEIEQILQLFSTDHEAV